MMLILNELNNSQPFEIPGQAPDDRGLFVNCVIDEFTTIGLSVPAKPGYKRDLDDEVNKFNDSAPCEILNRQRDAFGGVQMRDGSKKFPEHIRVYYKTRQQSTVRANKINAVHLNAI